MEGFAAAVVAIAIIAGAVLLVAFIFYCLVRISNADEVRFLPKWAWAVIVVCVNPIGGLAFLLSQHLRVPRRAEL